MTKIRKTVLQKIIGRLINLFLMQIYSENEYAQPSMLLREIFDILLNKFLFKKDSI